MPLDLTINEDEGLIYVNHLDENGVITRRIISPDTFYELIRDSYKHSESISLSIPPSCVHASVSREGNRFWGLFFTPAGKYLTRVVKNGSDIEMMVPFPNLLCKHSSNGETYVYVVKTQDIIVERYASLARPLLKTEVQLYHYPFSNVSKTGHVCWGANRFEEPSGLMDLEIRSAILINAVKTTHHASERGMPFWQYMASLCDLEVFPEETLLPMGVTYGQLLAQ